MSETHQEADVSLDRCERTVQLAILSAWQAEVLVQTEVVRDHLSHIAAMGKGLSVLRSLKLWLF